MRSDRRPCPREEKVVRHLVEDREVPPELLRHVESCPGCRSARRVAARLTELASASEEGEVLSESGLPPATELWRTAELRRRLRERERDARRLVAPVRVAEAVCGALAALAAGTFVPRLAAGLEALIPPDPAAATLAAASAAAALAVALGGLGISRMRRGS